MSKYFVLAAIFAANSASANCLEKNEPYGNGRVCVGTEVFLRNEFGEPRVGTVRAAYANGKVKVSYYYNGDIEVWRMSGEVSPKTECLSDICIGDEVFLKNYFGEDREGKIENAFMNGQVKISYYYGGNYSVFRDFREVSKTYKSEYDFSVGDSVFLRNDSGEERFGEIVSLSRTQAKIRYYYNGTIEVFRPLSTIAKEVKCAQGICKGDRVHFYNSSGNDRDGTVGRVFANGQAYIHYYYNGDIHVWRLVGSVSDATHCSPLR